MFVARSISTGLYLTCSSGRDHKQVPLDRARVYKSKQGVRHSITYGVPANNRLLDRWEILPVAVAIEEENK